MSLDIAIWRTEKPLGDMAAGQLYSQVVNGDLTGLQPHPAVEDFYRDLVARFPEIDDVPPDKVDDTSFSPWSCTIDRSPAHVLVSCVFSAADEVGDYIGELQSKYCVSAYVPAEGKEYFPHEE